MLVRFSKCSLSYLLLAFIPICSFFASSFYEFLKGLTVFSLEKHPFIQHFSENLFSLLSGVPLLFAYRNKKSQQPEIDTHKITIASMPVVSLPRVSFKINWKVFLPLTLLVAVFDEMAFIIKCTLISSNDEDFLLMNQFGFLQIIFCGLLSYRIMHYRLFKHHFLSITLFIIGFFLISINNYYERKKWIVVIYIFITYFLWALNLVISKWEMETLGINPFLFYFILSCLELLFSIIYILPLMYIPCYSPNCSPAEVVEPFISSFKSIFSHGYDALNLFISSLIAFIYSQMLYLANNKMTPTHASMTEILTNVLLWIYAMAKMRKLEVYFACSLPGYIIIILGCVLYNEIVILSFCSLDEFTKNQISQRSGDEEKQMMDFEDNVEVFQ